MFEFVLSNRVSFLPVGAGRIPSRCAATATKTRVENSCSMNIESEFRALTQKNPELAFELAQKPPVRQSHNQFLKNNFLKNAKT